MARQSIRPKYRPYDLRHFFASMLIEQRVNSKRIQYLMGHEDIRTTLNVYGHLIESVEAKAERTLGASCINGGGMMWQVCGERSLNH